MMKPKRERKCRYCGDKFRPYNTLQSFCFKNECIQAHNKATQAKKARKAKKEYRENDKSFLKAKMQPLANKYGRVRDELERGLSCCTCGKNDGKFDGGHFLPTQTYSAIRYNVRQIHNQCVGCNQYKSGMPKEYRLFMAARYGEEKTQWFENQRQLRSYTVEYYKKYIRIMSKRLKILEKRLEIKNDV